MCAGRVRRTPGRYVCVLPMPPVGCVLRLNNTNHRQQEHVAASAAATQSARAAEVGDIRKRRPVCGAGDRVWCRGTRGAAARVPRRPRCDGGSHLERISRYLVAISSSTAHQGWSSSRGSHTVRCVGRAGHDARGEPSCLAPLRPCADEHPGDAAGGAARGRRRHAGRGCVGLVLSVGTSSVTQQNPAKKHCTRDMARA